jgi:hypothetical protein
MGDPVVKRLPALVLLSTLVLGSAMGASAEEPSVKTFPAPPPPSECTASPVSEDELTQQTHHDQATPLATRSEPVSPLSLFPNSAGVEPQMWTEIESIEHQLVACHNAGDTRRAASLYTDSYLSRIVAASVDRITDFFPTEPRPIDQMNWKTVVIDDIRRIEDGHVVALVDYCSQKQVHYYLQTTNGWRIDDSIDVRGDDDGICQILPPQSTPTP